MSSDQAALPTEAAVEFAPESTAAPTVETAPAQPIRTDVDELLDIFKEYADKDAALQAMKNGLVGDGKDKRFNANGKSYSQANCRKAINRIEEKGLFKGQSRQESAKEGTYKEDAPLLNTTKQPQPPAGSDQTVTDIPPVVDLPTPPSVTPPPAIEPTIEQQLTEGPQTFAEIDPKASKKNGKLVQGFCKVLADYYNEPSVNVTNDDATEYGEDLAMLFPDLAKPKNSAAAHLIGGLILPRGLILAPKIKGTVDGLFGKKPQVKAA